MCLVEVELVSRLLSHQVERRTIDHIFNPMKLPTDAQVRALLRPEAYQKVLRAKASSVKTATDLEALDDWYRHDLSSSTRERGFMIKDELVKLMTWKLAVSDNESIWCEESG